MMEHGGGGEFETNEVARRETHESVAQNAHCSDNYKSDSKMEDKEISVAHEIESELYPVEITASGMEEGAPDMRDVSMYLDADKSGPSLESVKIPSVLENSEAPVHIGLTDLENTDATPETASSCHRNAEKHAINEPGHVEDAHNSHTQARRRKDKLKIQVSSSWTLRSRTQEKLKPPEPDEAAKEASANGGEGSANGEKKRRGRKKRRTKNNNVNEFSRMRTHLRYLLHRTKYEQSLIDAYSAEGWKGQSFEKLKPEKELQRAKSHIVRYKLRIRELFQRLDSFLQVGKLPESLFDDHGEIDSEDIFCAKCGSKDLPLDNDIILCDGACERGFHQFCLDPPLLKEDIPPGDEGWLCPGCDCKSDCIDMLKDFQGTNISIIDNWEKIFPEAAEAASGKKLDDGSSSDDSEDDNYDPDKPDAAKGVEASSNESSYVSVPDALEASNSENYMGLPSEDSEDNDFDPTAADSDKQVKRDSSSSDFTSDSEDLGALLDDAMTPGEDLEHSSPPSDRLEKENSKTLTEELSHLMENSDEPVSGRRHVERLDYKKLYDETYGNSSDSSDEDYNDTSAPKRRRYDRQRAEAISPNKTPITENKTTHQQQKGGARSQKRIRKTDADGGVSKSSATIGSTGTKRSANKRLGEAVTQRLYESFNKNQYPERAVKEQLATELNLTIQQISKWFENARWSSRHRSQMESILAEKQPNPN